MLRILLGSEVSLGARGLRRGGAYDLVESGPLEGPGEAHGGVLLDDVGEGLLAFRAFPRLHGGVGPRIHTLNPRQTSEEGAVAGWLPGKRALVPLPSRGPSQLARPT